MTTFVIEKRLINNEISGRAMRRSDRRSLEKTIELLEAVEQNFCTEDELKYISYMIDERIKYLHPSLKVLCPILKTASDRVLLLI